MATARRSSKAARDLDERLLRAALSKKAEGDGNRLYDMARQLKITPVQAVVRYFCVGRGQTTITRNYEGLAKILTLLNECEWVYDPAVKVNEGDDITDITQRWVVWDRDRPDSTISCEIRCTEDVVERFLKPLLQETQQMAKAIEATMQLADRRSQDRERKRQQRGTDLSARPCACCGSVFTPKRTDARCCSAKCRAKLSRQAAKA